MALNFLGWARRQWDVPNPSTAVTFAELRARINIKRLELLGFTALAADGIDAAMNLGFGVLHYNLIIAANVIADAGLVLLSRLALTWTHPSRQEWLAPVAIVSRLFVAQAAIYAMASIGRFTTVYSLYLLLISSFFVIRPRSLAIVMVVAIASYIAMVFQLDIPRFDQISTIRSVCLCGLISIVGGSLIHAARERDYQQRQTIDQRNALLRYQNERMDEVMAFAAHDLRGPLIGMHNTIDYVLSHSKTEATAAVQTLDHVRDGLEDVLKLIGGVLTAYEAEHGSVNVVDGSDLRNIAIGAAERAAAAARERKISFNLDLPTTAVRARFDPAALERVVDNLVANALRFSPRQSSITLRCRIEGTHSCLTVEDDGGGIPDAELPHLFEKKFRSGRLDRSGSGLGLFIVGTLVKRSGGEVSYARHRSGSIFTISFDSARAHRQDGAT